MIFGTAKLMLAVGFTALLFVAACGRPAELAAQTAQVAAQSSYAPPKAGRFIDQGIIWVDSVTGCRYFFPNVGAITPLLKDDGTPDCNANREPIK